MATSSSPLPLILTTLILVSLFIAIISFFLIKKCRRRRYENLEQEEEEEEEEEEVAVQEQEQEQEESAAAAPPPEEVAAIGGGRGVEEKRKKKRGKKKKKMQSEEISGSFCLFPCPGAPPAAEGSRAVVAEEAGRAGCPFPFSSFASATQRKIKVRYDELVRSNQAKALTIAQVGQFVNCLVEARNELQHKSEIIKRSFKIKKALLFRSDRSSFDRLSQQIYKLESEHKRLEEDATVYNLLQAQLKLSPAYKTMLEVGTSMELKGHSEEQDMEFPDISFEELLAQEMKDSFWQRNGKLRSCTD